VTGRRVKIRAACDTKWAVCRKNNAKFPDFKIIQVFGFTIPKNVGLKPDILKIF
jgi:hypothetical protein